MSEQYSFYRAPSSTAKDLADMQVVDDFDRNIVFTAKILVEANLGQYCYQTQYQSGNCSWGRNGKTVIVTLSGEIK